MHGRDEKLASTENSPRRFTRTRRDSTTTGGNGGSSARRDRQDGRARSRGRRGTTESQSTGRGTARPGSESITAAKRWSDGQVDDRPQQLLHLGAGFGRHDGEALDGVRKNGGFVGSSARSKAMAGRR
jgi:hypothetical protein